MISWFEKHNGVSWIITLIIAGIMFYLSSLTFEPSIGSGGSLKALIYHLGAYFFLGFFLAISMVKGNKKILILPALLIAILYGISDEIHQIFVLGRHFSYFDILSDSVGALIGVSLYTGVLFSRKKKLQSL